MTEINTLSVRIGVCLSYVHPKKITYEARDLHTNIFKAKAILFKDKVQALPLKNISNYAYDLHYTLCLLSHARIESTTNAFIVRQYHCATMASIRRIRRIKFFYLKYILISKTKIM